MATPKRARHEKGFYRSVERGTAIRADKIKPKKEKVVKDKMYPIEIIDRDKCANKVKIHFIGYSSNFDEWRDASEVANGEQSSKLGRLTQRFEPSVDSLPDRASAFFYNLSKAVKVSLYSSKRESPDIRVEERIDADIYNNYLQNIGVVKKFRGKDVHVINNNSDMCEILGNKWFERIINANGDFCYVVQDTVRFWLNEKRPVKEYFYVGDRLFENQIGNDLQLIFTFVRGDGVKAEYKTNKWK